MDEIYRLSGITFVWNREKALANPGKHDGVRFEQAVEVFFDPFLRVVDASRGTEARDVVIGMDRRWNLLFVVNIQLEDDRIRIISARRATRAERALYED
jgi:uncharacterized DUF497 family protein